MNDGRNRRLEGSLRSASLDMDAGSMRRQGYQVVDWLVQRFSSLPRMPLGMELRREETEKLLREEMPRQGAGFRRVFAEYVKKVAPNSIAIDHPRFFAFIPSSPNFISVLADALVAGTNVFAGTWLESSGPSQVEIVVIDWFKKMLGLPARALGLFVSGGSVANMTALAVARHVVLKDETAGARVYLSNQTHASIERGLRLLGFRRRQLRQVPTDSQYRLDPVRLAQAIDLDRWRGLRPFAVIANAGATNTGAVDPLGAIADVARSRAIWFHVDAAYGGFAALTARGRKLLHGISRADSVVLDPHKWFYCPYEAGCVIVREGRRMRETFRILPEYMRDVAREEREINFCDYGLQLTRSFRALKVWMAVKTFGADRFRAAIAQSLDLTEYAARIFEASERISVVTPPQLGIFTFRYVPERLPKNIPNPEVFLDQFNERLLGKIVLSRTMMLSSTRLGSRTVLRFCVMNHRTHKQDVEKALRLIKRFGREVERELSGHTGDSSLPRPVGAAR